MNLWIRSQGDSRLSKIEWVNIAEFNIDGLKGYSIYCNNGWIGEYKTKERALEVLDEIQNLIMPKLYVKTEPIETIQDAVSNIVIQREKSLIEQMDVIVYQMPKE